MPELKFPCPHCEQRLSCDAGYAGFLITCPVCVRDLVVPHGPGTEPKAAPQVISQSQGTPPRLYATSEDLDFWTEEDWNRHAAALERSAPKRKSTLGQLYEGSAGWFWYLFLGPPLLLLMAGMVSASNSSKFLQAILGWLVAVAFIVGVVGASFALARTHCRTSAGKIVCGLAYCVVFAITLPFVWAFAGCALAAGGMLVLSPIFSIFGK